MAKKKQTLKKKKRETQGKKAEDFKLKMSQTMSDVKTFIKNFKSDVDRKKKRYQAYAQELRKKKSQ